MWQYFTLAVTGLPQRSSFILAWDRQWTVHWQSSYIHIHTYIYIYMYVCMYVCMYVDVYISLCMCLCVYFYVGVHTRVCIVAYMCGYIHIHMCVLIPLPLSIYGCVLQWFRTHSCDPNSVPRDSNCARRGPDTLAIRRPTHEMIRDPYLFVQCRPDCDSDSEPRHFMQVYTILSSLTFVLILILPLNYKFWISYLRSLIPSCDHVYISAFPPPIIWLVIVFLISLLVLFRDHVTLPVSYTHLTLPTIYSV